MTKLSVEQLESRQLLHASIDWTTAEGEGPPLPNFALVDANPASPRSGQNVSPRDYLEQVSGWYFTHST